MTPTQLLHTNHYGYHVSTARYSVFVHAEMLEQTSMSHTIILLWSAIYRLPGLCIVLVGLIPYEYRHPNLI